MERLTRQYVATPKPLSEDRASGGDPTGRAALRRRIDDAFESRRLFADRDGVQRSRRVAYGDSGLEFTFDYGYERPSGAEQFIQTLSRRGEMNDVSRLCLVLDRLRGFREQQVGLAAVYAEQLSGESRALFAGSGIEPWDIAEVDALAERVHADLGR
jgi:hypothetical protein